MTRIKRLARRTQTRIGALLALLLAPSVALAADRHNSVLAHLVPQTIRAKLYEYENWGQQDVLANTIFFGLLAIVVLGWMSRALKRLPETRSQTAVEWLVEGLNSQFEPVLGEAGKKYTPFINSYFVLILVWNLAGLIPGFQAPTAELNTTLALAAVSLIVVQLVAIREIGFVGYIKHLSVLPGPAVMLPFMIFMFVIELVTQVSRVVSLSLRLFANIFAKEIVLLALYELSTQVFYIPIQLPVLFIGVLASLIQAFIFSILTAVYIGQFVEHAGHHDEVGHERREAVAAH